MKRVVLAILAPLLAVACARFTGEDGPTDASTPPQGSDANGPDVMVAPQGDAGGMDGPNPRDGAIPPCIGLPACPRYVFVTDETLPGTFMSTKTADELCKTEAEKVPKLAGRNWKAWLASNLAGGPSIHFVKGTLPYVRVDGQVIAKNFGAFASALHDAPINLNAAGTTLTGLVWTGTRADGTATLFHCNAWNPSTAQVTGTAGKMAESAGEWTAGEPQACVDSKLHFYCVEQ